MVKCAVPNCKHDSRKHNRKKNDISFHRFPKNSDMASKWVAAIRRPNWEPNIRSFVCSVHFSASSVFETHSGRRNLVDDAIPELKLDTLPPIVRPKPPSRPKPKQQYNPFKEFANDSSDEETLENEQTSSASETIYAQDKVFLNSSDESDDEPLLKKSCIKTEDSVETEEFYEFGKFVAEQLMCLDVEDARLAQEQIKIMLTKLMRAKTNRCLEKSRTLKRKKGQLAVKNTDTKKHCDVVKISVIEATEEPKSIKTKQNLDSQAIQSSSNANLLEQSVNQPLMLNTPAVPTIPVLNMNMETSMNPRGYFVMANPKEPNLTRQPGNTEGTLPSATDMNIETLPATQFILETNRNANIEYSEVTRNSSDVENVESLVIKYEVCSDDEM